MGIIIKDNKFSQLYIALQLRQRYFLVFFLFLLYTDLEIHSTYNMYRCIGKYLKIINKEIL